MSQDIFDFLDELSEEQSHKVLNDTDYIGSDGLIYCGKCHSPKQTIVNGRKFFCMCDCQYAEYQREQMEIERKQRELKIQHYRLYAFPKNSLYPMWNFENDKGKNPELIKTAKNFVEHFDSFKTMHKGLLLFGEKGTGKSFAAACIANAIIDKCKKVYMTNFVRITNSLQNSFSYRNEFIDDLCSAELLIIDDMKAERSSEYMRETIFQVIDTRYNTGLPLIVTSNITSAELKSNDLDEDAARIISRLLEMCHPIDVKGVDLRRESLKENYAEVEAMLRR